MSGNPVIIGILYGFTKHKHRKPSHGETIAPDDGDMIEPPQFAVQGDAASGGGGAHARGSSQASKHLDITASSR